MFFGSSHLICHLWQEMRLNMEYKIMTSLAPDYDKLPPLHKLEVFESALSETDGQVI